MRNSILLDDNNVSDKSSSPVNPIMSPETTSPIPSLSLRRKSLSKNNSGSSSKVHRSGSYSDIFMNQSNHNLSSSSTNSSMKNLNFNIRKSMCIDNLDKLHEKLGFFSKNSLEHFIPSEVGQLHDLEELQLSAKKIKGG
jgi:hypothetical protein